MTLQEFQNQTKRLIAVYGPNKYPQERLDIIYNAMKYIDAKSFGDQITQFIGQSEKAPLLSEFQMAFASVLGEHKKREIEAKEKQLRPCLNCDQTGVFICYSRKTGWSHAFQCTCGRGELYASSYPKQYPNIGEEFASHRAWVAGRFEEKNKIIEENAIRCGLRTEHSPNVSLYVKNMKKVDLREYEEIAKNGN